MAERPKAGDGARGSGESELLTPWEHRVEALVVQASRAVADHVAQSQRLPRLEGIEKRFRAGVVQSLLERGIRSEEVALLFNLSLKNVHRISAVGHNRLEPSLRDAVVGHLMAHGEVPWSQVVYAMQRWQKRPRGKDAPSGGVPGSDPFDEYLPEASTTGDFPTPDSGAHPGTREVAPQMKREQAERILMRMIAAGIVEAVGPPGARKIRIRDSPGARTMGGPGTVS